MKKLSVILYLLGISSLLFATTVNQDQLKSLISYHFPNKIISSIDTIENHVVLTQFKHGGFALSSTDDAFPGILAYSEKARTHKQNPAFLSQCKYYNEQIDKNLQDISVKHKDWDYKKTNSLAKSAPTNQTGPLLTSIWDQSPHYNSAFPYFVLPGYSTQQALVGCVAVVMGQLMNYYEHPSRGYGQHWYYSESTNTNMHADFDSTSYDYENMPDSLCNVYGTLTVPADQKADVTNFLLQCATAVEMEFLPGASSSAYEDMMYALKSHFDYGTSMYLDEKSSYTETEWEALLKQEIDSGRPIPYRGQGDNGGHAFILDGYLTSTYTYFHVNWGWGGAYNGWFRVSALEATTGYDFNDYQAGIFNIVENSDDMTRYLHSGFEGIEAGWIYKGGGFFADQSGYDLAHNGELAYGFDDTDQWLITPKLQVPNHINATLSIWAHMLNTARTCTLYVSTTDTNRTSFTNMLGVISPSNSNWSQYDFSLRSYQNQDVYVGINYDMSAGYITVDDMEIWQPKGTVDISDPIAEDYILLKAYPNPFNPSTTIHYNLTEPGTADIRIYDINGKVVEHLVHEYQEAGSYEHIWTASNLPSGIYICSLNFNGNALTSQKLLIVK